MKKLYSCYLCHSCREFLSSKVWCFSMGRRLTLVLGGARSGKSTLAEKLAVEYGGSVLYVATAVAFDDEMRLRIDRHKAERPSHWLTLEAPTQTGAAIAGAPSTDLVLLDCLTVLANNIVAPMPEPIDGVAAELALNAEIEALLAAYYASDAQWIIVSNEVGLGIVPAYPLGRIYRDALGRANQRLADAADHVLFMVAGLPMTVK
jgi:adenosylcobinamide kinase/adenosylcobinamide-phosphate guanylyltransferase